MKKVSLLLVLTLIVSILAACNIKNDVGGGADEMENEGVLPPLDAIVEESEWDAVSDTADGPDSTIEPTENSEDSADIESSTVPHANTDAAEDESTISSESESEEKTVNTDDGSPAETEPATGAESIGEQSSDTDAAETEEPETEPYDGMEVTIPDSSKMISEAYSLGLTTGYSVAKGSATIIQPDKDNPNIIRVVFETDDKDVRIAVNYHRKSESSSWKLVPGLPISVLKSEEN